MGSVGERPDYPENIIAKKNSVSLAQKCCRLNIPLFSKNATNTENKSLFNPKIAADPKHLFKA